MEYKDLEKSKELGELKRELELQMQIAYGKKALKLLGLKIGDKVKCEFRGSYISRKNSYGMDRIQDGTIKVDERGVVFVESNEPVQQTYSKSNNRSGSSYRSWWVEHMEITKANIAAIKECV